jgi:hypothetical protein
MQLVVQTPNAPVPEDEDSAGNEIHVIVASGRLPRGAMR